MRDFERPGDDELEGVENLEEGDVPPEDLDDFTDIEDDPAYSPDDPELKRLKGG